MTFTYVLSVIVASVQTVCWYWLADDSYHLSLFILSSSGAKWFRNVTSCESTFPPHGCLQTLSVQLQLVGVFSWMPMPLVIFGPRTVAADCCSWLWHLWPPTHQDVQSFCLQGLYQASSSELRTRRYCPVETQTVSAPNGLLRKAQPRILWHLEIVGAVWKMHRATCPGLEQFVVSFK